MGTMFYKDEPYGGGSKGNYYNPNDIAETDLQDADYVPFYDTSASGKRKTLWSNVKAKLKSYFDQFYGGAFSEIQLTVNSTYIDQNYTQCYSNGKICIVTFCFRLKTSTPRDTNIITGFPTNGRQNHGSLATSGYKGARMRVISGALQLEDVQETAWCNGSIVYPIFN